MVRTMAKPERFFQLSVLAYIGALGRLDVTPESGSMLLAALGMTAIVYLSRR
jgi:hypothetical protein